MGDLSGFVPVPVPEMLFGRELCFPLRHRYGTKAFYSPLLELCVGSGVVQNGVASTVRQADLGCC